MSALLADIQTRLQEIYEVSVSENVLDYVITDREFAEIISDRKIEKNVREQLLIATNDEYLDVSLYLDDKLVKRLGNQYPTPQTNKKILHDFWIALEGVSHFLYVAWNASHDRPVSQLELELQAEVDKFVSALTALNSKQDIPSMNEIWELLFSDPKFESNLENQSLQRYQKANAYASQYCLNLMEAYQSNSASIPNELRRFYRLSQNQKISYINNSNRSFCP